jgi:chromosome segregation ATPase
MTTALDETRDTIEKTARTIPSFIDRQKVMETYIQQEVDPFKRAQVELELKQNKDTVVEVYKGQLERFRAREQELTSQLQLNKTRLEELEGKLDLLERAIEGDRERLLGEKPAPVPKP